MEARTWCCVAIILINIHRGPITKKPRCCDKVCADLHCDILFMVRLILTLRLESGRNQAAGCCILPQPRCCSNSVCSPHFLKARGQCTQRHRSSSLLAIGDLRGFCQPQCPPAEILRKLRLLCADRCRQLTTVQGVPLATTRSRSSSTSTLWMTASILSSRNLIRRMTFWVLCETISFLC